jgi:hypothetical protein
MKKGAQISLFLIFALIILALGTVYLGLQDRNEPEITKSINTPFDKQAMITYFDECIESLGEDSLLLFGLQGGNMEILKSEKNPTLLVKTYFENGKNAMPSLEELENIYSNYLEQNLPSCMEKFYFPGYSSTLKKVSVDTNFYNDFVQVGINFPVTIEREGSQINLKSFSKKYSVRMGHIYNITRNVIGNFVENPDVIEYSYLMQFEENSFFIIPYNENLFIVFIQDNKSFIRNKNYNFIFGLVFEETKDDIIKQEIQELLT